MVLAYGVGGIAALLTLLLVLQFGGLTSVALWLTLLAAVFAVMGSFRYCKAFWTWVLYQSGELGERG